MEYQHNDSIESYKNIMLSRLYDKYESKMYCIAYSILNNTEQAEDAVHDAVIKLMPYLHKITDIDSAKTRNLITFTIKNVSIDKYRRNRTESKFFVKDTDETERMQSSKSDIKTVEDRHLIVQLLQNLPPKYREIIQYHSYYGLSYKEIAPILNISKDVAAKRFERAKKMVIEMMGDEKNE